MRAKPRGRPGPRHGRWRERAAQAGRKVWALLPAGLRGYLRDCGQAAAQQIQVNLSCPNCGRPVISARERILQGPFFSGVCPDCATGYESNPALLIPEALPGVLAWSSLERVLMAVPFLPLLVQNIISLFVLFPLCAFVSYCLVGTLALLLFPLAEDKKRR